MTRYTTLRTYRGVLHVGTRSGCRWVAICHRIFAARRDDLIVYRGQQALQAFRFELRCHDCDERLERASAVSGRL
jgi:hypothetical protein